MSDLVFKVKGEIGDALMRGDDPARAAIKAVADWLQEDGDFYAGIVGIRVEKQLKEGSE